MMAALNLHRIVVTDVEIDDFGAPEGYGIDTYPVGRPAPEACVKHKRSRVFRDDMPGLWALGWHLFLQALGLVLAIGLPVLCILFYTGVLPLKSTRPLPPGVITMAAPEVWA